MTSGNGFDPWGAEPDEMATFPDHDFSVSASEGVLTGEVVGSESLVRLLAAAAAPATGRELAGEEAAVAAFLAAAPVIPMQTVALTRPASIAEAPVTAAQVRALRPTLRPAATTRRPASRRSPAARGARLSIKVAAALAFVVAGAGVALAAGTGVLPTPFTDTVTTSTTSDAPDDGRNTQPGVGPGSSKTPVGPRGTTGPPATVPASMAGVCTAYLKQEAKDPEKAHTSPSFATLIAAAGGVEYVHDYCAQVLPTKSPKPTKSSDRSANRPTESPE